MNSLRSIKCNSLYILPLSVVGKVDHVAFNTV